MMFGNKKSAQEKALEKERKKYGTRKYGQTVLKHSRMGIWSCWYAAGASCFLLLRFWLRLSCADRRSGLSEEWACSRLFWQAWGSGLR